jgi:integrase
MPDVSTKQGVRDRALIELMYACGLRVSEAVNAKLGDIDVESGILTTTGKGSKTRRVPVGSSAVEWVKSYLSIRRKKEKHRDPESVRDSGGNADESRIDLRIGQRLRQKSRIAGYFTAYFAPFICDPSGSKSCGYQVGSANARARRYFNNTDLHSHDGCPPSRLI